MQQFGFEVTNANSFGSSKVDNQYLSFHVLVKNLNSEACCLKLVQNHILY